MATCCDGCHRGQHPRRPVQAALARADRRPLRPRLRRSARHATPRLGLAGRHHRQRPAVLRLHQRRRSTRPTDASPLFGQSGRQIFFIITSIYGWWRWNEVRKLNQHGADQPAITPRWATSPRADQPRRGSGWSASSWSSRSSPRSAPAGPLLAWYYWCDAWIFVGSMLATYAMARGWNEFWLAWIGVDLVGVPLGPLRLRPDRGHVRVLRRVRHLRLRRLGAGHPHRAATAESRASTGSRASCSLEPPPRRPARHRAHGRRSAVGPPRRPRTLDGREDLRPACTPSWREGRDAPRGFGHRRGPRRRRARHRQEDRRGGGRGLDGGGVRVQDRTAEEISQLLYHLQVLMLARGIALDDVYAHL